MVKRFSSHYIFLPPSHIFKLNYLEINDKGQINCIQKLNHEISNTAFFNGILIISKEELNTNLLIEYLQKEKKKNPDNSVFDLLEEQNFSELKKEDSVFLYILDGINLLTTKLGTCNSRSDCYIKRIY